MAKETKDWTYPSKELTAREFMRKGLAKPGVLIELSKGRGIKRQLLIGDINALFGVCDDCWEDGTIIRYKTVWKP